MRPGVEAVAEDTVEVHEEPHHLRVGVREQLREEADAEERERRAAELARCEVGERVGRTECCPYPA